MKLFTETVSGYSGFWNTQAQEPYTAGRYQRDSFDRRIATLMAKPGYRRTRAIMRALNGVAPGAAYTSTQTRMSADGGAAQFGGVRMVEPVVLSGVTNASQVTEINAAIYDAVFNQQPAAYPADSSGNGGGGKVGI